MINSKQVFLPEKDKKNDRKNFFNKKTDTKLLIEAEQRRKKLVEKLPPNSIAVIPSAAQFYRNADTEYQFRQNSDFYYLTGINYPNVIAVLSKDKNNNVEYLLFIENTKKELEIWIGPRINTVEAISIYRADKAFELKDFDKILLKIIKDKEYIYFADDIDQKFDKKFGMLLKAKFSNKNIKNLKHLIHELRLIKSKYEINCLKIATEISAKAHNKLLEITRPGMMEYELEAEFIHYTMTKGCRHLSYPAIIASGENSCILHYNQNDKEVYDKELVLVDAGAEYNYYAADITRTFPANGKFTPAQRDIYNLVLKAQKTAIDLIKPGVVWHKLQEEIIKIFAYGLKHLKIINATEEEIIEKEIYRQFYMHSSGHWLGLDVHDAGTLKVDGKWRKLESGMVFTVEPGIYIAKDNNSVDEKWRGIGVRIEDDILVTESGIEILSGLAKKEIEEIEDLMTREVL